MPSVPSMYIFRRRKAMYSKAPCCTLKGSELQSLYSKCLQVLMPLFSSDLFLHAVCEYSLLLPPLPPSPLPPSPPVPSPPPPFQQFPPDMVFVVRTLQILRGLVTGMKVDFSSAQQWLPIAREVLAEEKRRGGGGGGGV